MSSTSRSRRGAIRGNLIVQVTLCLLMCLRIAVGHYVSTKLWCSDPTELAKERQPGCDANLARSELVLHLDRDSTKRALPSLLYGNNWAMVPSLAQSRMVTNAVTPGSEGASTHEREEWPDE
ncbi:hypothetical protein Acr_10g0006900 [Actinidia rufa]|uniref:Uncharacterized protein n=1 Tax=Actinidia rufa TaxID=165716 RepID=A0A7J0F9G0_9ERIC|nr:hypothetical protein Acr_10g0006900 [Actinidia rufa]